MYKTIIKKYVENITNSDVIDYASKENVNITIDEAKLFVDTVKENVDDILNGNGMNYIESLKDKVSTEAYEKMIELFNKYKKFID